MQVSIKILEKEYRIACEYHEQDDLRASARLLDHRMREIRQSGRVIGTDRIAVMAALNIAHDLIQLQRSRSGYGDDTGRRLRQLQEQVAAAMAGDPPAAEHPAFEAADPDHESQPHSEPPLDASDERV
ncbi:cell division protein ZapA [Imhoffiella purpurea]|uniref:cell division protein ZapA n=1 Tax=Imhoffiella purpurea TaxID=1249627 RepID=UPI001E4AD543|nr:cell division protein ZapA [Imhoffiella purpurea]